MPNLKRLRLLDVRQGRKGISYCATVHVVSINLVSITYFCIGQIGCADQSIKNILLMVVVNIRSCSLLSDNGVIVLKMVVSKYAIEGITFFTILASLFRSLISAVGI